MVMGVAMVYVGWQMDVSTPQTFHLVLNGNFTPVTTLEKAEAIRQPRVAVEEVGTTG